jgi:hypothetical protein
MARVTVFDNQVEALARGAASHGALRTVAEGIASRVSAPGHLRVWVKAGDGPQGAFSQVIMEGPGALTEEFGNRTRPAKAPLRRALRGGR